MHKKFYFTLFAMLLGTTFILQSCESDSPKETPEEIAVDTSNSEEQDERDTKVKKIIYSIPSPVEMASLLKNSGVEYNESILNSPDNVDNYTTAKSQAINLGIYGADLRYTSMYEQDQQSLYYVAAAKKIAGELEVEDALDDEVYKRLNDNKANRDSLLTIVSESYRMLNRYLKENEREEISALVIAGGWVEGLHIACQHYADGNELLGKRIAEQKYVLGDLIGLMETYSGSDILTDVIQDLHDMETVYADVELKKGKTETFEDESGTMVIGGEASYSISGEEIAAITAKANEIRSKYIQ